MSDLGRTAAALALVGALLMQGVATAMLTAPPRVAHAVSEVPVHVDRATEIPELPTTARERARARERLSRVIAPCRVRFRAASTDAANATAAPPHRARSHPTARGHRDHDPVPH
jgi:hypothetical protein